jgi:hypothetical protein
MHALALLLAFLAIPPAGAASAGGLEKCRLIDQLPDSRLEEIARSVNSTVDELRAACREIRAPRRPVRPYRPRTRQTPRTPRRSAPYNACNCGANEVCVQDYLLWKCVSNNGPDNRCTLQGDCAQPGSRCVNGRCT